MFLSILVPVYNARPYLEECLHSLLEQDIPDYEILCVDDGSTDGSGAILNAFAAEYGRIVPIHQANSGVSAARNAGLEAASGEYIWFVDADDFIAPNVLGRLSALIRQHRCDQLVVGGFQFSQSLTPEQEALRQSGTLPINVPGPGAVVWRSLIRREFLLEQKVSFRPELTHGEDGQFLYDLSEKVPVCVEVPEMVYFYRVRSGSAETCISGDNQRKKLQSHISIVQIMLECYTAGRQDAPTANRLMSVLWYCLYDAAKLPLREARRVTRVLHASGAFPLRRPQACTITSPCILDWGGLLGTVFDRVYTRQNTRPGFWLMWTLCHLVSLIRPNG